MKSNRASFFALLAAVLPAAAQASDFEVALSSETAQFTFRSDSSLIGWGGSDLGIGMYYTEESDYVFQGSLLQMRQATPDNPLTLGVGVKVYLGALDEPDEDVAALAIGGQIRYTIAGTMPIAIFVEGHYAPDITSFSGADSLSDYTFGVQIEALPQTTAFVGVRNFKIEVDGENYDADDDNLHVGIRLTF